MRVFLVKSITQGVFQALVSYLFQTFVSDVTMSHTCFSDLFHSCFSNVFHTPCFIPRLHTFFYCGPRTIPHESLQTSDTRPCSWRTGKSRWSVGSSTVYAQTLTKAWVAKMQWCFDLAVAEGPDFIFSDEVLKGFSEDEEVTRLYNSGVFSCTDRIGVIRVFRPRR